MRLDGFRCDVADMYRPNSEPGAKKLDKIKPSFMLAEAETAALHELAFDMTWNWHLYYLMNDIAAGKKSAEDLRNYLQKEQQIVSSRELLDEIPTNHDENPGTEPLTNDWVPPPTRSPYWPPCCQACRCFIVARRRAWRNASRSLKKT